MRAHNYYVYILCNKVNTVFYVGVSSDIEQRVWQHKQKVFKGFTNRYGCDKLVYFEEYQWVHDAIAREKQLKGGSRQAKINLVLEENLAWDDLSISWYE